ncbi:hypothetical protein ACHQM5_003967 [Ranunculus cassubicifolius]
MENVEDIVIVGAGIAGLTTALGLHRMGIKSLVLESSNGLRLSGFALGTWTNGWRVLDLIGVGDSLRQNHIQLEGLIASSAVTGSLTSELSLKVKGKLGDHEVRCLRRGDLLETLAKELPEGTIRFDSKVVSIDNVANHWKLLHMADGSTLKTKVLVGSDGVNSIVAKSMGIQKLSLTGRYAFRGSAEFPEGHNFEPKSRLYAGDGFRAGFIPYDQKTMSWFYTFSPQPKDKEAVEKMEPIKMKEYVLKNLCKVPTEVSDVVERTSLDSIYRAPLMFRKPLDLLRPGAIYKGNVCLTGDALHAMTPDLAQGGGAALEDAIVLARCLGEVFSTKETKENVDEEEEYMRIEKALKKFADERKWRSLRLIVTAYMAGRVQQSRGKVISFLRDKVLSPYLAGMLLSIGDFDCGTLTAS